MSEEFECLKTRKCKICGEIKNLAVDFNYGKRPNCLACLREIRKKTKNTDPKMRWGHFDMRSVKGCMPYHT